MRPTVSWRVTTRGRVAAVLALLPFALSLAPRAVGASGEQIFRSQCAKCHGLKGEGVKDKYKDALTGDWSVEKLARYISKNMPEDKPGTCGGENAAKVAQYIHGAFYSREAQARLRPARVELVRLTNRQYINAASDLIQRFTGAESPVSTARGLQASYYKSRNIRRGDAAIQRVDPQVNFNFGTNFPPGLPAGTNGFAINWRGSVIAEETGEYEFSLKTPNGARLWLNDDETPLVDGSVASGEGNAPRATLRLIGGRAYPLQLEYFKTPYNFVRPKDATSAIALQWKPPHGAREPIPARNLVTGHAPASFVLATPFPPDDSSVGYERGVSVSKAWDDATTQAAIEVAGHVVKNLDRLSRSKPADADRAEKVEAFCSEFVEAAFRRPLTAEQKLPAVSVPLKGAAKVEDGVKRVVLLALKSPRFLFLGLEGSKPDDFTAAERLSFALWDSLPDAGLLKAAAAGQLRTREQVAAQAQRMLADPRARLKMQGFFHHWLQMSQTEFVPKDGALFPGFTAELAADLRVSLNLFLDDILWKDGADYRKLLLADHMFVNDRLATFYGIEADTAGDFVKVALDAKQRAGVVTHPYLLATFAYPKSSSPIHRGVFLTRNIVGRALREPAMAVAFKDSDFAPDLTMREKITELTRPKACQGCHSVINPLGFSLEQFDAVGRFRTQDNGRPVNAASDYATDDGNTVRLAGARDVAEFAAGNEQAHAAFVELLFHHTVKQPMSAYGAGTMDRLRKSFAGASFNIQSLLVDIATTSALHGIEKSRGPVKTSSR